MKAHALLEGLQQATRLRLHPQSVATGQEDQTMRFLGIGTRKRMTQAEAIKRYDAYEAVSQGRKDGLRAQYDRERARGPLKIVSDRQTRFIFGFWF